MSINPFEYGGPITNPARFFGRLSELNLIRDACFQLLSISIVGERRAGKSSLLRQFTVPEVIQRFGFEPKEHIFCFFDLQGLEDIELNQFWGLVLAKLVAELPADNPHTEDIKRIVETRNFDNISLRRLFARLEEYKIIFLFDEFETILENQNFSKSFYGHLRYLTQNCPVALITVTRRELVYHCLDDETKSSPFFNIFHNLVIKPFNKSECKKLVEVYTEDSEVSFTESEITKLIDLSGGYAAFFQFACSFLFYAYQNEAIKDDEIKRLSDVEEKFRIQANPQFAYYWNKSEEEEKIVLTLIALLQSKETTCVPEKEIKKLYPRYKNDLLILENRSLVLRNEDGYQLFSPLFSGWILVELADSSQKGEVSLDEWVADYKKTFVQSGLESIGNIREELVKVNPKYWSLFGKILQHASNPHRIIEFLKNIGALF
ncbi:MAG: hypothetical protein GY795_27675 [Desulfobacterales bacterium]|nr:hypothetical protein [Desulfobacterales bacterium]